MNAVEFEYHLACRRKDVHFCFIMRPGKMIFVVYSYDCRPYSEF